MNQIFSAPAKIILLGEHAVVYGHPSLAVPFSTLRTYARVAPNVTGSGLEIIAADLNNQRLIVKSHFEKSNHPLVSAAWLLFDLLECNPPDAIITLHSDIPVASGMGSGAAVTTSLFRALLSVLNSTLDDAELNNLVYEVEKIHHGTPSGIDNTVIVYERPIYFVRGQSIERLQIKEPFTLLVGDTGTASSTKVAVGDVRELYDSAPVITGSKLDAIGNLVKSGRLALETGNAASLGEIMNENHKLLRELTVSSDVLDALVVAACVAGALGAKLSGAGRGGTMIALVSEEKLPDVKDALLKEGAVRVYETVVGK